MSLATPRQEFRHVEEDGPGGLLPDGGVVPYRSRGALNSAGLDARAKPPRPPGTPAPGALAPSPATSALSVLLPLCVPSRWDLRDCCPGGVPGGVPGGTHVEPMWGLAKQIVTLCACPCVRV